jgi:hypothetical protein
MKRALTILLLLAAASVSPLIFPIAESGRSSMDILAKLALLPVAALLLATVGLLYRANDSLARISAAGLAAGAVATIALEVIRLPCFWLGFMPGNLPRLMGVLLLDQFASGPSLKSDIAGWAYHFWNGASFGLIYVLVFGRRILGTGVFKRIPSDRHGCSCGFWPRLGLALRILARLCRKPSTGSGMCVFSEAVCRRAVVTIDFPGDL